MEKYIEFYENGKYYRISFMYPNADLPGPNGEPPFMPAPDAQTVRGETLISAVIIERVADGRLLMTSLVQCDWKFMIPAFMITTFLPRATKEWVDNVCKYYNKNHKVL